MQGIRHTGIYVKDLGAMISFYQNAFDMNIVVRQKERGVYTDTIFGENDVDIEVCKLEFSNKTMIELIYCNHTFDMPDWKKKIYQCGEKHIAITVDSADEMYQKLGESGCVMLSEPYNAPDGKARVFFARDLEGNYMELVEELRNELDDYKNREIE